MEVLRKAFNQELDPKVSKFVSSVEADAALIEVDIYGSLAHAAMLRHCNLITEEQYKEIKQGLEQIAEEARAGIFQLNPAYEDVHMNVEKRLESLIGQAALSLHTARSRNDQVALDLRLYAAEQAQIIGTALESAVGLLVQTAKSNLDAIMPGYTHLQRAQPVSFAHALLAFRELLLRDAIRFQEVRDHAMVSPLGAGAQAGTSLPIDTFFSAKALKFQRVFANSIDAVSDRDFVADFLYAASMAFIHLSQMAETLIIWSSKEFGFIELADSVTTTSSLMPQKKNPDPLEIIRGKAGSVCGELVGLLITLKGLPLGYNRDLQETKPPLIRCAETLKETLAVVEVILSSMTINRQNMLQAASDPEMISTDIVEYLVLRGVPFRRAHDVVSQLLKSCRDNNISISDCKLGDLQKLAVEFENDVFVLFDPEKSVNAKISAGSTGSASIRTALGLD
jgi:argininosuccinate lyase